MISYDKQLKYEKCIQNNSQQSTIGILTILMLKKSQNLYFQLFCSNCLFNYFIFKKPNLNGIKLQLFFNEKNALF